MCEKDLGIVTEKEKIKQKRHQLSEMKSKLDETIDEVNLLKKANIEINNNLSEVEKENEQFKNHLNKTMDINQGRLDELRDV